MNQSEDPTPETPTLSPFDTVLVQGVGIMQRGQCRQGMLEIGSELMNQAATTDKPLDESQIDLFGQYARAANGPAHADTDSEQE